MLWHTMYLNVYLFTGYVVTGLTRMLDTYFSYVPTDISGVIGAMEHALLARAPRIRYIIGLDAWFAAVPIQLLPEWLGDYIFMDLIMKVPTPASCLRP